MYIVHYSKMIQRDGKWYVATGKVTSTLKGMSSIRRKCKEQGLRINAIIPVYP